MNNMSFLCVLLWRTSSQAVNSLVGLSHIEDMRYNIYNIYMWESYLCCRTFESLYEVLAGEVVSHWHKTQRSTHYFDGTSSQNSRFMLPALSDIVNLEVFRTADNDTMHCYRYRVPYGKSTQPHLLCHLFPIFSQFHQNIVSVRISSSGNGTWSHSFDFVNFFFCWIPWKHHLLP